MHAPTREVVRLEYAPTREVGVCPGPLVVSLSNHQNSRNEPSLGDYFPLGFFPERYSWMPSSRAAHASNAHLMRTGNLRTP